MIDENVRQIIEETRQSLHKRIDSQFDEFIESLESGRSMCDPCRGMSLKTMPAYFKGNKPISIVYPDGTVDLTSTWRKVAKSLLQHCAEDNVMRERMYVLCDRASGKSRYILSSKPDGMDIPIEICPNMYFEGKYDTESMLRVITNRIFDTIGYRYLDIEINIVDRATLTEAVMSTVPKTDEVETDEEMEPEDAVSCGFSPKM